MRVTIEKVIHENTNILVSFTSSYGRAQAYWHGKKPIADSDYDVEVNIKDTLEWGKDVLVDKNCAPSIQQESDLVFISGCIEYVDEDGYAVIRLDDSIIAFMTRGEHYQVGTCVTLTITLITLYPVFY